MTHGIEMQKCDTLFIGETKADKKKEEEIRMRYVNLDFIEH